MKITRMKSVIFASFIAILLFSGCIENITNKFPGEVPDNFEDLKHTLEEEFAKTKDALEDEFARLKEFGVKGLSTIEDIVINEDNLIREISKLEPINDKTIEGVDTYKKTADHLNLLINILNREVGLDLDFLQGTQDEYEKLSKIITEYIPLVGNYNKIVTAAKDYNNGNLEAKEEFYKAIAEFSLEFIIIQGAIFYKPAFRATGIIYRNIGLNRLAFKFPSIVAHLLKHIHWYLRNLMVNKSSEIAGFFIGELSLFEKVRNS